MLFMMKFTVPDKSTRISRASHLLESHDVFGGTEVLDRHLYHISILQIFGRVHSHCDSSWCTSHNDSTLLESSSLTNEAHNVRHVEQQIIGAGILAELSIDKGLQTKIVGSTDDLFLVKLDVLTKDAISNLPWETLA